MKVLNYKSNTLDSKQIEKIAESFRQGKIGVIPTDTIYGICGSALNKKTVEKIYQLRDRAPSKPMIILISDIQDLKKFNLFLSEEIEKKLKSLWPNPLSVVLPLHDPNFYYLHRGTNSLAFRMPNNPLLLNILKKSGPLVAPSANISGKEESTNISQAKKYFYEKIDFYLDGGEINSQFSTLICFENNQIKILRQGAFKI